MIKSNGFTLIELLVAAGIVVLLSLTSIGIVAPLVKNSVSSADKYQALIQLSNINRIINDDISNAATISADGESLIIIGDKTITYELKESFIVRRINRNYKLNTAKLKFKKFVPVYNDGIINLSIIYSINGKEYSLRDAYYI